MRISSHTSIFCAYCSRAVSARGSSYPTLRGTLPHSSASASSRDSSYWSSGSGGEDARARLTAARPACRDMQAAECWLLEQQQLLASSYLGSRIVKGNIAGCEQHKHTGGARDSRRGQTIRGTKLSKRAAQPMHKRADLCIFECLVLLFRCEGYEGAVSRRRAPHLVDKRTCDHSGNAAAPECWSSAACELA